MITRKIGLIGEFSVGKTSLVRRFVHSVFSEKYLTTVGVKIDTKVITDLKGNDMKLVIWDIAGSTTISGIEQQYLKGMSGYLSVADGTRGQTLDIAFDMEKDLKTICGSLPHVFMLNKFDLEQDWEIDQPQMEYLKNTGMPYFTTSALSGENVEQAFISLASMLTEPSK